VEIELEFPECVYLDLKRASEDLFGLHFFNPRPLTLGLLNLKWKVETEQGIFVLKQFSKERYERFGLEKVALEQEFALRVQLRQYEKGIPCPKLLAQEEKIIHMSPNGERFVVMEFMSGDNLRPGMLNKEQMFSLGQVTARMHNLMNDGSNGTQSATKFAPPSIEQRLKHWMAMANRAEGSEQFLNLVENQIRATEQFDLDFFGSCRPGWAHRDLWVENILYMGNQVSAILDFDRCAFDFPELDIARAIMSGTLNENEINTDAVKAFVEGYRMKRELEKDTLVRSLQLLWYLENVWWIRPDLNRDRYQEVQFENEMTWLADNLTHLTSIFADC